ncbi:nitroreductase family protein [Streptomyces antimycoticus]|uniref:nitroreductase family protein n=3 Tax=Streptomyces TaxID=1883 RepID=UPI0038211BC9
MDLDKLMNKHLTRYFDPSKTIPEETLQQLLRFLRSTPSSVNVQPQPLLRPRHARRQRAARQQPGRTIPGQRREGPERVAHHHSSPPGQMCLRATSRRCARRRWPTAGSLTCQSRSCGNQ